MKVEDLYRDMAFPTIEEIRKNVRLAVGDGAYPEDDWIIVGGIWEINVWKRQGKPWITIYPMGDHFQGIGIPYIG